ncbi:uncharacterized protein LOC133827603 [Humulus lupulus]|uniref:uncharacterized protein LOC133827603 n=1 Tax=Humulus lupulus TaxID=3486 RepID=UPI002B40244D|nr:uncharacterized protein LOC133827603 [Humulus lupulus]
MVEPYCFKQGGSTTRTPMLDGTNYACWKARMRAFLKAMDERVWSVVVDGWTPPTIKDGEDTKQKPVSEWTTAEAITNCEIAKDAWDKLQTKNEGTKNVKNSRLRSLTTEFENFTMTDDESITEFHARLCDITTESFALGETYSDSKLVRKVLGALPRKFKSKVNSIEECHDVDTLDLDELIGSLWNYELTMKRWSKENKEKRVSSGVSLSHKAAENIFVGDSLEILDEEKAECANTLKKKGRALAATWSDSEEDQKAAEKDSSDLEENFVAFTVKTSETPCSNTNLDGVCSDEDDLDQQTTYEQMYNQWVSVIKKAKILEIKVGELEEERKNLLGKVDFLTLDIEEKRVALEEMQEKLDYANKTIETYIVGEDLFDNMMGIGQFARKKHGVGFNQPLAIKKKDLPNKAQVSLVGRKQWRQKNAHTKALVVHTSLLACNSDQWYFDSGCSRHMTENKHLLTNLLSYVEGYVTFGDGSKGRIMGRGELHLHGLPPSKNVLYVEGIRSKDNCYLLSTNLVCNAAKTDETKLWHYKLGHLNYRDLSKLVKLKVVRGVPNMALLKDKGEKVKKVIRLRSDHGKEFENNIFADFCNLEGIVHEFSAPKTPQQNGVVERKN